MYKDILEVNKKSTSYLAPNKYKSLIGKSKIIIEDSLQIYGDIFQLPNTIYEQTGYKYVFEMIDYFSKWYGEYLSKSKMIKKSWEKLKYIQKNFEASKILQVDNGGKFSNHILENYCDY